MRLESYLGGEWKAGNGEARPLVNPVTGAKIAEADSSGLDLQAALDHARVAGGAALRNITFAERGALLKSVADVLAANRDKYEQIARENSGNTKVDAAIDIDGGIGTLKYYARLGGGLGETHSLVEAGEDQLAREPVFGARHYWNSRPGVAVQINAFNFPSWGMWEKIAAATVAGVPSLAKPATSTAMLSFEMMRDVIAANVVPDGVFNFICGSGEGLLDAAGPMDSIAFTGSAATGFSVRSHANVLRSGVRVNVEADSINGMIVGPDVGPGSPLFDLAVRETVKALSVKAGQLCTNIRRIFVPRSISTQFCDAVAESAKKLSVGDPADEAIRVGPLVNRRQQETALEGIGKLSAEARVLFGGGIPEGLPAAIRQGGAFVAPTLLLCDSPQEGKAVHETEVFGPCSTVMPCEEIGGAIDLATFGGGSLALSLFTGDGQVESKAVRHLGPWHGRIMIVDETVGRNHTGHAIVMPQCVHGGPGRAGGGEELGGLRGLRLHMQRTAVQTSPQAHATLASRTSETAL